MFNPPLISVIVPVYNVEKYLERCIKSILNQSFDNIELILVNDGSKDSSLEICNRYKDNDNRVTVIHKENAGVSSARNTGLDCCKGQYIGFVDSDDWIDSDMYEVLFGAINEYDADIAMCSYREVDEYEDVVVSEYFVDSLHVFNRFEALKSLLLLNKNYSIPIAPWNKLYKRELLDNIRFVEGKIYEDIVFTAEVLFRVNKCVCTNHIKYNYLVNRSGSTITMGFNKKSITDELPMFEKRLKLLKEHQFDTLFQYELNNFAKAVIAYDIKARLFCVGALTNNEIDKYISAHIEFVESNYSLLSSKNKLLLYIYLKFPFLLKVLYRIRRLGK